MKRGSFLLIVLVGNSSLAMRRDLGQCARDEDIQAALKVKSCAEVSLDEVVMIEGIDGEWRYAQVTYLPSVQASCGILGFDLVQANCGMLSFDPDSEPENNFAVNFKKIRKISKEVEDDSEKGILNFWKKLLDSL